MRFLKINKDNLIIVKSKKRSFPRGYILNRQSVWDKKQKEYKNKKIPLWNGTVLNLLKSKTTNKKLILTMNLCEYKDVLYKEYLEKNNLKEDIKINYVNVQCIITDKKNNLLFGTTKTNGGINLIAVGGTLREERNNKINSYGDIQNYMIEEIKTETKLKIDRSNLIFKGIIINNDIVTFVFFYKSNSLFKKGVSYFNRGEFSGELFLKFSELNGNKKFVFCDRLLTLVPKLKEIIYE